jgi:histidyl-tRNA synthetase
MVLFGDAEVAAGVVKIKDLDAGSEEVVPEVRPPSLSFFSC